MRGGSHGQRADYEQDTETSQDVRLAAVAASKSCDGDRRHSSSGRARFGDGSRAGRSPAAVETARGRSGPSVRPVRQSLRSAQTWHLPRAGFRAISVALGRQARA